MERFHDFSMDESFSVWAQVGGGDKLVAGGEVRSCSIIDLFFPLVGGFANGRAD